MSDNQASWPLCLALPIMSSIGLIKQVWIFAQNKCTTMSKLFGRPFFAILYFVFFSFSTFIRHRTVVRMKYFLLIYCHIYCLFLLSHHHNCSICPAQLPEPWNRRRDRRDRGAHSSQMKHPPLPLPPITTHNSKTLRLVNARDCYIPRLVLFRSTRVDQLSVVRQVYWFSSLICYQRVTSESVMVYPLAFVRASEREHILLSYIKTLSTDLFWLEIEPDQSLVNPQVLQPHLRRLMSLSVYPLADVRANERRHILLSYFKTLSDDSFLRLTIERDHSLRNLLPDQQR